MAGKKRGFFIELFFLLFLFQVINAEEIGLRLLSMNNREIEQVGIAKPFFIQVDIPDGPTSFNEPKITKFNAQRTGIYVNTVNGNSTTRYTYKAVIDSAGEYSLGPIVLGSGSQALRSPTLSFKVGLEEIEVLGRNKKNAQLAPYFVVLYAEEKEVYIKEPINMSLSIFYRNGLKVKSFELPDIPDVLASDVSDPVIGSKRINGVLYRYVQWNWRLYPQVAGNLIIPSHSALVEIEAPTSPFDLLSFFKMNNAETRRIYSDGQAVQVNSLIGAEKEVDGVGQFYDLSILVEKATVKEGEAFTLKISLLGDTSLEIMSSFKLKGIHDSLRWYFSKSMLNDTEVEQIKIKEWQFVVQALKPGEVVIPAQTFYFFNTQTYDYEMLYSDSIVINIEKNDFLPLTFVPPQSKQAFSEGDSTEKEVAKQSVSTVIYQDSLDKKREQKPFSLISFLLLLLVPSLIILRKNIKKCIKNNPLWQTKFYRKYLLFRGVRRQIIEAKNNNEYQKLHSIIMHFMSQLYCFNKGVKVQVDIDKALQTINMSDDDDKALRTFLDIITHYSFDKEMYTANETNDLFSNTLLWIDFFERKCSL